MITVHGIPDRIQIGPIWYTIEVVPELTGTGSDGESVWLEGTVRTYRQRIKIEERTGRGVKPIIVIHEAVHAILAQAGIDEHHENVVSALGFGIVSLIQDNPDLVSMIQAASDDDA